MTKTDIKDVPKKAVPLEGTKEKHGDYTATIIRDFDGKVDPWYLPNKDPNYAYRFLRDDPKNIRIKTGTLLLQKGGWQICPKEHLLRIGVKPEQLSADGLYRAGDTILAFIPKKLLSEKEKYKLRMANEPMDMIKRMLKKGDPSVGRGMHNTMRGLETAKQLGMKT